MQHLKKETREKTRRKEENFFLTGKAEEKELEKITLLDNQKNAAEEIYF